MARGLSHVFSFVARRGLLPMSAQAPFASWSRAMVPEIGLWGTWILETIPSLGTHYIPVSLNEFAQGERYFIESLLTKSVNGVNQA